MRESMPVPRSSRPGNKSPETAILDIEDWLADEPDDVHALFVRLPHELWEHHYNVLASIESHAASGTARHTEALTQAKLTYLVGIIEARRKGLEEFKSYDARIRDAMSKHELGKPLQELHESSANLLGAGGTAKVKQLELEGIDSAVKYLLTPTENTLPAEGEHDMLWEVDTMTSIEDEERKTDAGHRIRVPHPHFFYKNEKFQCYGLEKISGRTMEQLVNTKLSTTRAEAELKESVWMALAERYADPEEQTILLAEAEKFMFAVHSVCLHGDMRPANVMVDEAGVIYLIDFGRSEYALAVTSTTPEQLGNRQALEQDTFKSCLLELFKGIRQRSTAESEMGETGGSA